jgi:DNA-binding response OmpR family regulator
MDLGADDYLIKPYSIKALLLSIRLRLDKKASLQEEAQQELSDFRYRLTRSLPKRLNNLISPLHSAANTLKQLSDNLTVQEIEEIAEKIENNSVEIHRLFINLSLYSQLEMIASNPKMREAYQSKRSQCFPSAVITKSCPVKSSTISTPARFKIDLAGYQDCLI